MDERILDIILFLLSRLNGKKNLTRTDFLHLARNGYTKSEIGEAFGWLSSRDFVASQEREVADTNGFRILSIEERRLFDLEAYGYLVEMIALGVLQPTHIEMLIDSVRFTLLGPLSMGQLKNRVSAILKENDQPNYANFTSNMRRIETIH